jgi:hypothetical protein
VSRKKSKPGFVISEANADLGKLLKQAAQAYRKIGAFSNCEFYIKTNARTNDTSKRLGAGFAFFHARSATTCEDQPLAEFNRRDDTLLVMSARARGSLAEPGGLHHAAPPPPPSSPTMNTAVIVGSVHESTDAGATGEMLRGCVPDTGALQTELFDVFSSFHSLALYAPEIVNYMLDQHNYVGLSVHRGDTATSVKIGMAINIRGLRGHGAVIEDVTLSNATSFVIVDAPQLRRLLDASDLLHHRIHFYPGESGSMQKHQDGAAGDQQLSKQKYSWMLEMPDNLFSAGLTDAQRRSAEENAEARRVAAEARRVANAEAEAEAARAAKEQQEDEKATLTAEITELSKRMPGLQKAVEKAEKE